MKKFCKICKNVFVTYDKKVRGRRQLKRLPVNRVTCSKECARKLANKRWNKNLETKQKI